MKHVSILVPETAVIEAVADPRYLFSAVNQFLAAAGRAPLFEVKLVAVRRETRLDNAAFSVHADLLLDEVEQTDLVIIPALSGNLPAAIEANKALIPWIVKQYNKGAEVASLCLGAFLFASTGLLDGKKCSTHWGFCNEFRARRWKWWMAVLSPMSNGYIAAAGLILTGICYYTWWKNTPTGQRRYWLPSILQWILKGTARRRLCCLTDSGRMKMIRSNRCRPGSKRIIPIK